MRGDHLPPYRHPDGRDVPTRGTPTQHALERARAARVASLVTNTNLNPCFACGGQLLPKDLQKQKCRHCGAQVRELAKPRRK